MSRSKARLAAEWFAKLRTNTTTQIVEHQDVAESTAPTDTITIGGWTISEIGGTLYFTNSSNNVFKLEASGKITSANNVVGYGTV